MRSFVGETNTDENTDTTGLYEVSGGEWGWLGKVSRNIRLKKQVLCKKS